MIKLCKSVMAALVMSALIAGLFCCQKKEGPAERAGRQIDKVVEKAGQQTTGSRRQPSTRCIES